MIDKSEISYPFLVQLVYYPGHLQPHVDAKVLGLNFKPIRIRFAKVSLITHDDGFPYCLLDLLLGVKATSFSEELQEVIQLVVDIAVVDAVPYICLKHFLRSVLSGLPHRID